MAERRPNAKHGRWQVTFTSGAQVVIEGDLRVWHDDDGFVVDYELEGPTVGLLPSFDRIDAIVREDQT